MRYYFKGLEYESSQHITTKGRWLGFIESTEFGGVSVAVYGYEDLSDQATDSRSQDTHSTCW